MSAASATLVDPAAPRVEVFGPALLRDRLKRPDLHATVQRDRDSPGFASVGIGVLQDRVAPALAILSVVEGGQDADDLPTGEVPRGGRSSLEPGCVRLGGVRVSLAGFLRQFDRFVEVREGLLPRVALAGDAGLLVDR